MSASYYNQKWEQAINDLMEQIEDEGKLTQLNKNSKEKKKDIEWFQYFSNLYIRYIDIYKKLQDCYDQIVNPQKRLLLREMLDNAMVRMCEIKQNVVYYSTQTNIIRSDFINFDEIVMDLKLTPKCLEVPIPRYFKQQDKKKLIQRNQMVTQLMIEYHDTALPQEQVIEDRSSLDANFQTAVRIIQKIQRGRQGIIRGLQAHKIKSRFIAKKSFIQDISPQQEQAIKITTVQKYFRAFQARKNFFEQRQGQLKFLGMIKDPIEEQIQITARQNRIKLKKLQIENQKKFLDDQDKIKHDVRWTESTVIKQKFLQDRRKWIQQYFFMHQMKKLPKKASQYYKQMQITSRKTSKQKKLSKQKSKNKSKTDRKSLKKLRLEPSQAVGILGKSIQTYSLMWNSKQINDLNQPYNLQIARNSVRPQIEKQMQEVVDSMINVELDNMRIQFGIKKKKLKKRKAKKKKKAKKIKIPYGLGKKDPKQLLAELIDKKIVKYLKPATIKQFIGQHNPLGSLIQKKADLMPDPSYAQIREVITQYIAIPLGSKFAKIRLKKLRWFYFFGPTGTGKTHMVRSLQTQCNALLFDLTPSNIQYKYPDKKSILKLMWMTMIVSKKYQPSIILVDEFQKIFTVKKKKKKQPTLITYPPKMKKAFVQMKKNKLWTKNDRIIVIACSNKPYQGSKKICKKMFDKKLYFPYPNYATRKLLFQSLLNQKLHNTNYNIPIGTIAHISEGFTPGSYKQCIEKVLTQHRIKRLNQQPLRLSEFIVPLSNTICTYAEQYERLQAFTYQVTGLKKRREKRDQQLNPSPQKKSPQKKKNQSKSPKKTKR